MVKWSAGNSKVVGSNPRSES